jgi:hypothetical protein
MADVGYNALSEIHAPLAFENLAASKISGVIAGLASANVWARIANICVVWPDLKR